MTKEIVKQINIDAVTSALMYGDLSKLNDKDKLEHYKRVCESVGLNPLTSPLQYIALNGKLILYASKNTTEQLRSIHKVSVVITSREKLADVYSVTAKATMPDGRCDESIGAVNILNLKGDALANALMKAETKAKRRVTLSICSLGMLDETEVETIIHPIEQPKEAIKNSQSISENKPKDTLPTRGGGITEKQRKRLFAISKANGWEEKDIKKLMKDRYSIESTKELSWNNYDNLCKEIEMHPKKVIKEVQEIPPLELDPNDDIPPFDSDFKFP